MAKRKKARRKGVLHNLLIILISILLLIGGAFALWNQQLNAVKPSNEAFTDVARLYPAKIREVRQIRTINDIRAALAEARTKNLKVSMAGSHHSQGGQTYAKDVMVLEMRSLNAVKQLDTTNRLITVEAGITWGEIQSHIAPKGLAVGVMQSSNIFTVGGTLSANAHGRDMAKTTVVETVQSFRLIKSDGTIVNVSRQENRELFKLVIGGLGMFGVITDATLELVPDEIYEKKSTTVDYRDLPTHFRNVVKTDPTVRQMLIRPSVDLGSDLFLKEMIIGTWHSTDHKDPDLLVLQHEKNVLRDKIMFDLSRRFDWAKSLRWQLQKDIVEKGGSKYVSRNNAMRPPTTPLEFLGYHAKNRTDIIQEYYVPTDQFIPFMDDFRQIIKSDKVNIISSTIRYVKANNEVYLSHTPQADGFSVIVMSNIGLDAKSKAQAEATTRKLVDASIRNGGSHYLIYQLFPSLQQLKAAYPNTDTVFEQKRVVDPGELFTNKFYEHYAQNQPIIY